MLYFYGRRAIEKSPEKMPLELKDFLTLEVAVGEEEDILSLENAPDSVVVSTMSFYAGIVACCETLRDDLPLLDKKIGFAIFIPTAIY